jgi:flagellar assembly protein FliH
MRDPQPAAVSAFELPEMPRAPLGPDGLPVGGTTHAASIVEEARQTAAAMLAHTRAACETDKEAARAAGYEAGYAAGMEAADSECAALLRTAEQIGINVASERERLLIEAEGEIVDLAIAIASKVLNTTIDLEPETVVEVCRGAMRKAFQRETLVVRAHPEDLATLREAGPRLAAELGGVQHLEFVEERRLQPDSLIVRTPAGEIDATFAGKLDKIGEELRELARTRAAERRNKPAA